METKVYILENLCCANCAARIEEKFNAHPGVQKAVIVFPTRQLRLSAEGPDTLIGELTELARTVEPDVLIVPGRSAATITGSMSTTTRNAAVGTIMGSTSIAMRSTSTTTRNAVAGTITGSTSTTMRSTSTTMRNAAAGTITGSTSITMRSTNTTTRNAAAGIITGSTSTIMRSTATTMPATGRKARWGCFWARGCLYWAG